MHFWAQGCAPPTPMCPFKSDKSVSIQGPERPIANRLGITTPGFWQGCGLSRAGPCLLCYCQLKLSTPFTGEPMDQGGQEGPMPPLPP